MGDDAHIVRFSPRRIRSYEVTVLVGQRHCTWGRGWEFGRDEAPPHVETPETVPLGEERRLTYAGKSRFGYIYSVQGLTNPTSRWGAHLTVPFALLPAHEEHGSARHGEKGSANGKSTTD